MKSAKTQCYTTTSKYSMTSLRRGPLLRAGRLTCAAVRQCHMNGIRVKVFSEWPRHERIKVLFGEVSSMRSLPKCY